MSISRLSCVVLVCAVLAAPAMAAPAQKILYDRNGEIYIMNIDGSGVTRLTFNTDLDYDPSFDPEGKYTAFVSTRDGNFEIYTMALNGSRQTRLTTAPAGDVAPAYSPSGDSIVFASWRDGNSEIYRMKSNGSAQTNLSNNSGFGCDPPPGGGSCYDGAYDAQPDEGSNFIAFISNRDNIQGELYIMNGDGSDQTRLTNNVDTEQWPSVSVNGQIAYTSNQPRFEGIWVMDSDGSNRRFLHAGAMPNWCPDGKTIVFSLFNDIYIMKSSGSAVVQLTTTGYQERYPDCGYARLSPLPRP